jgi:argininosuccinate lyase
MDAVSDRDFAVEFLAAASICMMHCSRMAEELVLWMSAEFGFVKLGSQWVTGSSMMPQKRNPDFAELARGKTGRVYGSLIGLLTTLKGLPLTYNRDLQEDKEGLFDAIDTVAATLEAMSGMLRDCEVNSTRMEQAAQDNALLATDMADYLVAKGVSFRSAHAAVSALCQIAEERGVHLLELPLEDLQQHSTSFDDDVRDLTALASVTTRDVPGGTSPSRVRDALIAARARLEAAGG